MKTMPRLLSVNVGLPRDIAWQGKTVHTAVWKTPVQGRRLARRLNIDGDGQGDLAGHGGEHEQSLSTRSSLIVIGKTSSVETTLPAASSERILQSRDWPMLKCALAIITGSAMLCSK
jgi:MOSC domain-containing protein YiiM